MRRIVRRDLHDHVEHSQVVVDGRNLGVLVTEGSAIDGQCLLVVRFGPFVIAHGSVEPGQVVEALSHVGMLLAEHSAADGQRVLEERLGSDIVPHGPVEQPQVVEAVGDVKVLVTQGSAADGQCLLEERHGLGIVLHGLVEPGQVVKALDDSRVIVEVMLAQFVRMLRYRQRLLIAALLIQAHDYMLEERHGVDIVLHGLVEPGQVVKALDDSRVIMEVMLAQFERMLRYRQRLLIAALLVKVHDLRVQLHETLPDVLVHQLPPFSSVHDSRTQRIDLWTDSP
jgi:hypothetical protein